MAARPPGLSQPAARRKKAGLAKAVAKLPAPRKVALHGRCISGGVRCHSPSPDGKHANPEKSETPCGDRGFGVNRRHLAIGGKVEAAGILTRLNTAGYSGSLTS